MSPKKFIEYRLTELKPSNTTEDFLSADFLKDFIFQTLFSKKFRKFSMAEEYVTHIKTVIERDVELNLPIKLSFPFGGYKLWRLTETPEVDWAELFTLMYYAKWLKPVCDAYKPGIIFDFASDDIIVERMNNIPKSDTIAYKRSFIELITFLENYIPKNLKLTFTPISSFYSPEEFEIDLQDKIKKKQEEFGGLPVLDDKKRSMVELNVKLAAEQHQDLLWREKVELLHQAYYAVDKRRPYNRASDKILTFCGKILDGKCLSVGTTKTSIAKFWVGVGALKRMPNGFQEYVLSPNQVLTYQSSKEPIYISGLEGKNFQEISIFESA